METLILAAIIPFAILATGVRDPRVLDLSLAPRIPALIFGCATVIMALTLNLFG